MANLMTGSTNYKKLQKKYKDFAAPTIKIMIDGADIIGKYKADICDLTVDLTSGFEASGCNFSLSGEYQYKQSGFNSKGAFVKVQLGAKIEILMGYIVCEEIFSGYITQIGYSFTGQEEPMINVECIDAKGIMMKRQRLEFLKEKKIDAAVKKILDEQPYSTYLKDKKVEAVSGEEVVLQSAMDSDYDFIVAHAKKAGYEFFIMQGIAYFRKRPTSASPIMEISPRNILHSAEFTLSANDLVGKIQVVGIDGQNFEAVKGKAAIKGKFSKGSTAKRLLDNTVKVFYEQEITSEKMATDRATQMMQGVQASFGNLSCTCTGIPEIIPGRFIDIAELSPEANKTFYITNVTHSIIDGEFSTSFEARINSL